MRDAKLARVADFFTASALPHGGAQPREMAQPQYPGLVPDLTAPNSNHSNHSNCKGLTLQNARCILLPSVSTARLGLVVGQPFSSIGLGY
jgi:hypothetical protein